MDLLKVLNTDSDDSSRDGKRDIKPVIEMSSQLNVADHNQIPSKSKKRFSIWSEVLTDQTLSEDMKHGFKLNEPESKTFKKKKQERDVEEYEFWKRPKIMDKTFGDLKFDGLTSSPADSCSSQEKAGHHVRPGNKKSTKKKNRKNKNKWKDTHKSTIQQAVPQLIKPSLLNISSQSNVGSSSSASDVIKTDNDNQQSDRKDKNKKKKLSQKQKKKLKIQLMKSSIVGQIATKLDNEPRIDVIGMY